MDKTEISGYRSAGAELTPSHDYLLPALLQELDRAKTELTDSKQVFELRCGNGSVANFLSQKGWDVCGVGPSSDGILQANASYPHLDLRQGSAYDDLLTYFGQFPIVTRLEVVDHVYAPRQYAKIFYSLLQPCGTPILSTPYHRYLKNLVLVLTDKIDALFTALWDHGHIKFWSTNTLSQLLHEPGFKDIRFRRVGRIALLAKPMMAIARKP